MRIKIISYAVVPLVLLCFVSCKEKGKEEASVKEKLETVVESIVEPETAEPKISLSVEERAGKLGFAKYLPADTQLLLSVYDAKKSADQLKALKVFGLVQEGMGMGMDPVEDESEVEEGANAWTLLGQEVTVAFGSSSAEQMANFLTFYKRMTFFQAEGFGSAAHALAQKSNEESFDELFSQFAEDDMLMKLLDDQESGISLIEKTVLPTLTIAFKAAEGELEQASQLVNSSMAFFGMLGEMAEPVELETAGTKLLGYKLKGAKFSKLLASDRESMEEDLSPEQVDALLSAISKKNLICVSGTIGDYVVFCISGDESAINLVADPNESLVANSKMDFVDKFADKPLVSVSFGDKKTLQNMVDHAGGLASYALGFRKGIASGENLGETRDIEQMLQLVADREKALLALCSVDDSKMIAYVEDGLKVEISGGYDKGAVDWDAPTELAHLGNDPSNLLFVNFPRNAAYSEELSGYLEVIFETSYAIAMKFSELEIDAPELVEMRKYSKMFDETFRKDLAGIYDTLSEDFAGSIGKEAALVIDLKGSMPAIPGLPQEVVDQGKAPRLTLIAPITDREKLGLVWEEMNESSTSLLAKISEMTDKKIPMQKPISSEKDGMVTWFIALPFFQDDFLPSVTLSDDWFAASTSKVQVLDIIKKASDGGKEGNGVNFHMNFNALSDYADEMLKVVDKNKELVFDDAGDLDEFNNEKANYEKIIAASREFDSLSWTIRKEDGVVRNRIHFKTK